MRFVVWFCLLSLSLSIFADPFINTVDSQVSVSEPAQARSIFLNPALLSFQNELGNPGPSTSFTLNGSSGSTGEGAIGLAAGPFGFGFESLVATSPFHRYTAGLGFPVSQSLFLGASYAWVRPLTASANGFDSISVGSYLGLHRRFGIGFFARNLNQPLQGTTQLPVQFTFGASFHAAPWWTLRADIGYENSAANPFSYEIISQFKSRGMGIQVSYNSLAETFGLGLTWALGQTQTTANYQPRAMQTPFASQRSFSNPSYSISFQAVPYPYKSAARSDSTLALEIDENLTDGPTTFGFLGGFKPTLLGVLKTLEKAEKDESVKRIIVRLKRFPLGLASAEELQGALLSVREHQKQVDIYLGNAEKADYLIASAGSQIYLEDSGTLMLPGFSSASYYLRGTLDKIGIEPEVMARGEYKSAPEMFERKEASGPHREATFAVLKEAEKHYTEILKKSRPQADWEKAKQHAVFNAEDAKKFLLIDGIASYQKDFEKAKKQGSIRQTMETIADQDLAIPSQVAVVVAQGNISGMSGGLFSAALTAKSFSKKLERAMQDPLTRAVVVRVNSPGGEVLPSAEIAESIERAREKLPVVISMGDVAASGGYLISTAGDSIVSNPFTLTGSIGVFFGKPNLAELYKKIDLHKEILSDSPFPGLFSEHKAWTKEERAVLERHIDQYYANFVGTVARTRKLSAPEAEAAAKGRVWIGSKALTLKLVDSLGGYREAITLAAEKAGLEAGAYQVELYANRLTFWDFVTGDPSASILSGVFPDLNLLYTAQPAWYYWSSAQPLH